MLIRLDDLQDPRIVAFLEEHLRDMRAVSPPESVHALDLDGLRQPGITFWTSWDGDLLVGCGALKELDSTHGEIKIPAPGRGRPRSRSSTRVARARPPPAESPAITIREGSSPWSRSQP